MPGHLVIGAAVSAIVDKRLDEIDARLVSQNQRPLSEVILMKIGADKQAFPIPDSVIELIRRDVAGYLHCHD